MALLNSSTSSDVRRLLDLSVCLLKSFEWLLDAYVVDFFTEDHWEKLPRCWRFFLENLSSKDLSSWLDPSSSSRGSVAPLSLTALKTALFSLSLSRTPLKDLTELETLLGVSTSSRTEWKSFEDEFGPNGCQHRSLRHVFRKHVKPKKQHEIARMSDVAETLARATSCTTMVDVGAGAGHLSRYKSWRERDSHDKPP